MIKKEDLERMLWDAANIIRSEIDFQESKNYLLRLLLLKRLSDVFEEEAEAIERRTGSHDSAWNEPHAHRFFVPENSRWSCLQRLSGHDIGYKLNEAARAIEAANPDLEEIFTSIDFGDDSHPSGVRRPKISSYNLIRLIHRFSFLNLRDDHLEEDALGEACENLIERFAVDTGKTSGFFLMPSQVRRLLVYLLEPQENMSICDPVCGPGGFLIECVRQVKQQEDTSYNLALHGQEKNYETWIIAKINLLLHNIFDFDIRLGDIIYDPQLIQNGKLMQFDRVITNPPFSLKNWSNETVRFTHERFRYGTPPQSNADFAFIQHILSTLNTTGRASVLVPYGVLFRGGVEGKIRRGIIEDDLIEAVIGLPSNLFHSIAVPITILILNKNKSADRKAKILFIDASKEYQKDRFQNNTHNQVDHIIITYRIFRDKEGYSKVVSVEEIAANDYTLSINRYVLSPEVEIDFDDELNQLGKKLLKLDAELAEAESEVNKCLHGLGINM